MLEEHSGGNYPFPALEIRHKGAGDDVNSFKSGNIIQNKHLSNSAESLNKKSGNLAPSKYYQTDQLAWRLVNILMQLFYWTIVKLYPKNMKLFHLIYRFHFQSRIISRKKIRRTNPSMWRQEWSF